MSKYKIKHVSFKDLQPGSEITFYPANIGRLIKSKIISLKCNTQNCAMHIETASGTIVLKRNGTIFLQI